jgi:hypothetical protein
VLEGLLHPHSSIPYVQTGLIIALYMVILFLRESCDFVFISQYVGDEIQNMLHLSFWGLIQPLLRVGIHKANFVKSENK